MVCACSQRSDYSKALTRIRDAVAALPVDSAARDGDAIALRPDNSFYFPGAEIPRGHAEAILVAYDIMRRTGRTCALSSCCAPISCPFK